jgi:hypothetical protein
MREPRLKSQVAEFTSSGVREAFYQCPLNCRTKVVLIYFVNANGTVDLDFEWYRASDDVHYYIFSQKNLSESETVQPFSENFIILDPGDKLEITLTGTTPQVDAICTLEETFFSNSPAS